MTNEQIAELIEPLRQLSRVAGEAILSIYKSSDIELSHKDDNSPLTLADRTSNQIIVDGLKLLTPTIPIISEEDSIDAFEIRKSYKYCWLVDPLDGTKEFVKRNDEFTTNIALALEGRIILGVVYAPVYDDMYWASAGNGAFKKAKNEDIQPINCTPFEITEKALRIVCSRSHLNEPTQAFVDNLTDPILIRKGSSLKMMHIAEGKADIYPRLGPTMEWDTAASQIIIEEAGGTILENSSLCRLSYNKENLLNPYFLAQGNRKSNG